MSESRHPDALFDRSTSDSPRRDGGGNAVRSTVWPATMQTHSGTIPACARTWGGSRLGEFEAAAPRAPATLNTAWCTTADGGC